jgi:hypothetical protein
MISAKIDLPKSLDKFQESIGDGEAKDLHQPLVHNQPVGPVEPSPLLAVLENS